MWCRWHRDGSRFLVVPTFHEIALLTTTDIVMIPPFHTECLGWMFDHGWPTYKDVIWNWFNVLVLGRDDGQPVLFNDTGNTFKLCGGYLYACSVICVTETFRLVYTSSSFVGFQQVMLRVLSHPHFSTNRTVIPFTSWPIGVLNLLHIPKMIQKQGKCGIMALGRWLRFAGVACGSVLWVNALHGIVFWRRMCYFISLHTKKPF